VAGGIGRALGIPVLEMDEVHWGPDWRPRRRERIRAEVSRFVAGPDWVVDGNYRSVSQDLVWGRADTVVWLDLPFRVVAGRLLRRTAGRILRREVLWSGNRERLGAALGRDSILLYLARTFRPLRRRHAADAASGEWPGIEWIRLRSAREVEAWLDSLDQSPGDDLEG
jgi:hypothetical protein